MRGKGFRIMLATILSTVLHFFILTLLDTIPLISKEIPPQPNLYMVDLVPLVREQPAPQQEEKPAVQQRVEEVKKEEIKEEVKKEEVKKEEVTREEIKKEEVKKEEVKEVEKKEEVQKEDKEVAADAGAEQAKKDKTEEQPLDPDKQLSASIEEIKQKVASRENGDPLADKMTAAEIAQYPTIVEDRIKGFWVIPDLLLKRELKAVVVFGIDKQGEVTNLRFKQSSGNTPYDQSVIRAIRKAAPFSPPPQVLLEEEYELTFEPKTLRK